MLAELEGPSTKKKDDSSEDIDDFDGFMKKLELDQKPAPQQQTQSKPVQPTASKPVQQPPKQQATPQHKPVVQQQQFQQPSRGGGGGGDSVGEKLLVQEGFVRHNNKGKFVNYRNGKATDFRIKGTTSSKVGLLHVITLRALDDYGAQTQITEVSPKDFIAVILTHRETKKDIQPWFKDNNDGTYDLAFYNDFGGTVRMEIKLCGNPMFDLDIQVDEAGDSLWVALGEASCQPNQEYKVDIVTSDGSRPEGVAPFDVQTMGDISDLKLVNNGDGTYYCECVPHSNGFVTIQICLHGEPIRNSPLTVQVGEKTKYSTRQTAVPEPKPKPTAQQNPPRQQSQVYQQPQQHHQQQRYEDYGNKTEVTNDDLNALLDELGGY